MRTLYLIDTVAIFGRLGCSCFGKKICIIIITIIIVNGHSHDWEIFLVADELLAVSLVLLLLLLLLLIVIITIILAIIVKIILMIVIVVVVFFWTSFPSTKKMRSRQMRC